MRITVVLILLVCGCPDQEPEDLRVEPPEIPSQEEVGSVKPPSLCYTGG